MKIYLSIALIALTALSPAPASAGFWEVFFPSSEKEIYNPYETLKAPFADKEDGPQKTYDIRTGKDLLDNTPNQAELVPLNLPHANVAAMESWLENAVTDAMTFTGRNSRTEIDEALAYFTDAGQSQYWDFLRAKTIDQILNSGQYQINSAIQNTPLLIGEQESGGLYKWLFEVSLLMSFLETGTNDYEGSVPQNLETTLKVQLTRAEITETNPYGVLIELWQE